jgi:hypothetical protein
MACTFAPRGAQNWPQRAVSVWQWAQIQALLRLQYTDRPLTSGLPAHPATSAARALIDDKAGSNTPRAPFCGRGGEPNTEDSGAFVIRATVSAKCQIDLPAARSASQSKKPVDATEVTPHLRRAMPTRVVEWHPMAWTEHTAAQPPDGTFINLSQVREIAAGASGAPGRAHPVPA